MKIALVREAGGYGDIICMSGASKQLCSEIDDCKITAFVPAEFLNISRRLEGFSEIVSLGTLGQIKESRRTRDTDLAVDKSRYLRPVFDRQFDKVVDLYCPGFYYETTEMGRLQWTRSQLFAMAAGCKRVVSATPQWNCTQEDKDRAYKFFDQHKLIGERVVGFSLRGTCSNRVYPRGWAHALVSSIQAIGCKALCFDNAALHYAKPQGAIYCQEEYCTYAAIVRMCSLVVTMDSSLLHLAQAVGTRSVSIYTTTDATPLAQYYNTRAVQVERITDLCTMPCNYSHQKGWESSRCRPAKCKRIETVPPEVVLEAVLKEIQSWS